MSPGVLVKKRTSILLRETAILAGALALLALAALGAQRLLFPRPHVSSDLARSIDAGLAPLMREQVRSVQRVVTDPRVTGGFAAIMERLRAAAPGGPAVEVLVIESPEINAFTLPGGIICVTTGIMRVLETADEMSGVLAHELAHAASRDPLAQVGRELGMAAVAGALSGGRGAPALSRVVQALVNVRYGRDAEDKADDFAVDALAAAGIAPEAFALALGRLKDAGPRVPGSLTWLDPHAPVDERIRRAEKRAGGETWTARPLDVDWKGIVQALPRP